MKARSTSIYRAFNLRIFPMVNSLSALLCLKAAINMSININININGYFVLLVVELLINCGQASGIKLYKLPDKFLAACNKWRTVVACKQASNKTKCCG